MSRLKLYLEKLKDYYRLLLTLHSALEPLITLKSVDSDSFNFAPTYSSISEQIKNWPESEFLLPPAAWIHPHRGSVQVANEIWEFAFHGAGLSFIHSQTSQDISAEYSNKGELGITEYTTSIYLQMLPSDESQLQELLGEHTKFFNELIKRGYLVEIPPLLPHGDQTFILKLGE